MAPKIGLALGSGGLRGLAHLGVLKVLEEENIRIDCISGCSIGSLIGALYCCGHKADTIIKLAKHLKRRHWLDFVVPKMGLFSGDKVLETMSLLTQRKQFSDLDIPLSIVATDLNKGESITLNDGVISKAVRASISVPGIFVPYQFDDKILVDGAVLNPMPIDIAFNMGADVVIGVDLSQKDTDFKLNNIFDVIIKSIDIMEQELMKSRRYQDNLILIRPCLSHISPSSFDHIDECIHLGEICARRNLPALYNLLSN